MSFIIGKEYTKKDIYKILSVPIEKQRGSWETGYHFYDMAFYIFANIGVSGRSGHNYPNKWIGEYDTELEWYGKSNTTIGQPQIQNLISRQYPVHIFTRSDNRFPFTYEGEGVAEKIEDTTPVKIIWSIKSDIALQQICTKSKDYTCLTEGGVRTIGVNKYERNPQARKICLRYFGYKCMICGFDFEKTYGKIGENYIHVHHIKPITSVRKEYVVDPIHDLIPICPNCHAIIHSQNPPISVEKLRFLIIKNNE